MAEMDIRSEILSATIPVFNKKGIKFTMDDVAKEVGISNGCALRTWRGRRVCSKHA